MKRVCVFYRMVNDLLQGECGNTSVIVNTGMLEWRFLNHLYFPRFLISLFLSQSLAPALWVFLLCKPWGCSNLSALKYQIWIGWEATQSSRVWYLIHTVCWRLIVYSFYFTVFSPGMRHVCAPSRKLLFDCCCFFNRRVSTLFHAAVLKFTF